MKQVLKDIEKIIKEYGYFRYHVKQELTPDYSYTIGLKGRIGFELIFAGLYYFHNESELQCIFDSVSEELLKDSNARNFDLKEVGAFKLINVDDSWTSLMMLGAMDYYQTSTIKAFQIIPTDPKKITLDIPDMSKRWDSSNLLWKYLDDTIEWEYSIPQSSRSFTNLDALRGNRITEFIRFESDEWEIFAGNGSLESKESLRFVPMAVMIGLDSSIIHFFNDPIGKGKFRDSTDVKNDTWYDWL